MVYERTYYNRCCEKPKASYTNCLLDIIKQIDKAQKEVKDEDFCIGCTGPLTLALFDTRPVSFTLKNNKKFTAKFGLCSDEYTDLFRIEDVRKDCVLLRLLCKQEGKVVCTKYTVVLLYDCVCAIQCFEPINCGLNLKDGCTF